MPWPTSERMIEKPSDSTVTLDRGRDVAEVVWRPRLLGAGQQRVLGHVEETAGLRVHGTDRHGDRGVRHPAVLGDPDVERDDVAALQLVGPGIPWTTIEFGEAQIDPGKPR